MYAEQYISFHVYPFNVKNNKKIKEPDIVWDILRLKAKKFIKEIIDFSQVFEDEYKIKEAYNIDGVYGHFTCCGIPDYLSWINGKNREDVLLKRWKELIGEYFESEKISEEFCSSVINPDIVMRVKVI
jgi:hypothetical protein